MAGNQTIAKSVITNTLAANTVDLAILTGAGFGVRVTNLSGTAPIWFTVSHQGGACPVPTVGGASEYCVASVAGLGISARHAGQFGSVVQLISSGTPLYMVEVQGNHANS